MKRFFILLLVALLSSMVALAADAPVNTDDQAFSEATKLYGEGRYSEASDAYRALIASHPLSAALHANLARANYRDKKLPEAILEMRRAAALSPRDPEIRSDLALMRDTTSDRIVPHLGMNPLRMASNLGNGVSEREAWKFLILTASLFFALLSLRLYRNRAWVGWAWVASGVMLVLSTTLLLGKLLWTPDFGVVKADEAPVRSGTATTDTLLFKLHEGTEFNILKRSEGGWVKIELADGKIGWVEGKDVVF